MKNKKKNDLQIGGKLLLLLFFALISGKIWGQVQATDVLTASSLGVNWTASYADFSGRTLSSGVTYSGNAMMTESGSIQMRSGNNSGLVTTSAVGKVRTVRVTWNTATISGRALSVYGKNKAYTGASDLYASTSTKQGTLLGELTCSSSGTSAVSQLDIVGDYDYVGFRVNSNTLYITRMEIVWELKDAIAPPVLVASAGETFTENTTITAEAEDGSIIYYTTNGENPTTSSERFPENGLTVSSTVTIKAIAVRDGVQSPVTVATYTKREPVQTDGLTALVFEKDGLYYAAVNSLASNGVLGAMEVDVVNGKALNPLSGKTIGWYVDESEMTIKSPGNQYVAYSGTGTDLKWQASAYVWYDKTLAKPWHIQEANGSERTLLYSGGTNGIKAYAISNIGYSGYSGDMQLMPCTDGYVRSVTGVSPDAPKLGTICLPCDVEAGDFSGAVFHSVLGKITENGVVTAVALSGPLQTLKAGTPYIFSATSDKVLVAYTGEALTEAKVENGLIGSLGVGCEVPEGKYLVSNNMIQICGPGCYIASNRAYLDFDLMNEYVPTAGINARMIILDEATEVDNAVMAEEKTVDVYRLDGICVRRQIGRKDALTGLPRGLYVVEGKKIVVE